MHSSITLSRAIGGSPRFSFQYRQVCALVEHLVRYCNIFRLLTSFELLLASHDRQKLLLNFHNILLMDVSTKDKAKLNWERDFFSKENGAGYQTL